MASYDKQKRARWEIERARIRARMVASRQVSSQVLLDHLASPDQVHAWLEAKPPDTIVGNTQTPDDTIVANYLWETLGVYVMTFGYSLFDQDQVELPAWCREFYNVETERSKTHLPAEGDWPAAEALAMLEEAERRLQSG